MSKQEAERVSMYRCIIESIIKGEKVYVEWLTVMMQVSTSEFLIKCIY